jgi:hypothetical protein
LQPVVIIAGNETVLQRLETDPLLAELALGILMPVQAPLPIRGLLKKSSGTDSLTVAAR